VKKVLLIVLMSLLFCGVVTASGINGDYKGNPIVKVTSNGKLLETDEVPAHIIDGHTLVIKAARSISYMGYLFLHS
jgi:hypothetical protein